ncbi:hypothetical protein PAHAL_5G215500 [Panicum hallii]|uniref:Phosphatidic acid phosphatase type 2/haloperoxidase domain-containing protein n=1 Tax=Panicum hallii TaxID=206008 RepID=A0A2T8IKT3_9POAL|nr:lipid phosphate phosphatase 2-like isoform X3 [Panicum hallii]PVH38269.1 hypothetical protein PAHAL_5G215500 [Panicum hallii]
MSMPYKNDMTPVSPTNLSKKKKKKSPPAATTEAPFDRVRYCQVGSAPATMASNEAMWGSTSSGGAPACAFPTVPRVARSHAWDWVALLLLVAVDALLNVVEPFHRFVGAGMMADLGYPMKANTVPVWAVPVIAVIAPVVIFIVFYIRRRNVYDLHHAILAGILFAVLITGVLTDAIKDAVGRPRPNFFWRCFPDGKAVYDSITTGVICHGDPKVIKEGHKSFPSGHTSWSFAGLGFLSWYLAGKITVFDRRGHVAKLCVVLLPLLVAAMVAISRVDDYWHHWQDVCTGGVLGLVVASVCYLQFFPAPSDEKGFWPHAHFRFITEQEEESRGQRPAEAGGRTSHELDAMEAGRRDQLL